MKKIGKFFVEIFGFRAVRRGDNLVDLEKSGKNAPTLAIVAVDTAENEPSKVCPLSVYRSLRFYLSQFQVNQLLERVRNRFS